MFSLQKTVTAAILASAIILSAPQNAALAAPNVVASVPPVHSLIAAVMEGVGSPLLLLSGGASPHSFALKPSHARALQNADAIFWVGEELETFLKRPLSALGRKSAIVELSSAPGIQLLETRKGGAWETDEEDHIQERGDKGQNDDEGAKDEIEDEHAQDERDMHIWLDPGNAKHMVRAIVNKLAEIDPGNAAIYGKNARALDGRIDKLTGSITDRLIPVKKRPYLVFHDGYHYFEKRFATNAIGSLTASPERKPGARRVAALRKKIIQSEAACVFTEPQFQPAIVRSLVAGSSARIGVLDPVGGLIPSGPDGYFTLMENLAEGLVSCLTPSS